MSAVVGGMLCKSDKPSIIIIIIIIIRRLRLAQWLKHLVCILNFTHPAGNSTMTADMTADMTGNMTGNMTERFA